MPYRETGIVRQSPCVFNKANPLDATFFAQNFLRRMRGRRQKEARLRGTANLTVAVDNLMPGNSPTFPIALNAPTKARGALQRSERKWVPPYTYSTQHMRTWLRILLVVNAHLTLKVWFWFSDTTALIFICVCYTLRRGSFCLSTCGRRRKKV